VLEAGDRGGTGAKLIFLSLPGGFVYKFLSSALGLIKGTIEGAIWIGKSVFYVGSDLSVALLGIGYLVGVGPRIQQIVQILGVLSGELVIHFVLKMLHHARRMGHSYLLVSLLENQ